MLGRILKIVGWLLLGMFLVVTFSFSFIESKDIICEDIHVNQVGEQAISLDKNRIISIVKSADNELFSKEFKMINTGLIEDELEKNPTVENAEVYKKIVNKETNYKGILGVRINYRSPLVRVMANNTSYYLDSEGVRIPVSSDYSANVLVVSGNIEDEYCKNELLPFLKYIEENEFWKNQIEQIYITVNDEITLTPLVGDHFIDFGGLDNYQVKLRNLKAFYMQVLADNNWNKYKRINLKFENQVIGTKR